MSLHAANGNFEICVVHCGNAQQHGVAHVLHTIADVEVMFFLPEFVHPLRRVLCRFLRIVVFRKRR